jgi:trypsin
MIWCGGVLIAPEVVLSAAHCESYVGLDVHVSGYQWASTGNGNGAVLARVVDEEMHPQFDGRTLDNDFFLHRLDSKVDLQTDITLRLNEDDGVPANGQGLSVMGLGLTEEGGRRPQRLNDVDVQYIPTKDCNKDLNGEVSDNMFCAGVDGGGKDR